MSVKDDVRRVLLSSFNTHNMLMFGRFARENSPLFSAAFDSAEDEGILEGTITEGIHHASHFMYTSLTQRRNLQGGVLRGYADHVVRPEYLAYSLSKGTMTPAQINTLPFDHGQTAETFVERYGVEDLPLRLVELLFDPSKIEEHYRYFHQRGIRI